MENCANCILLQNQLDQANGQIVRLALRPHGYSGYSRGCRCEICTKERAIYQKNWRVYGPRHKWPVDALANCPAVKRRSKLINKRLEVKLV